MPIDRVVTLEESKWTVQQIQVQNQSPEDLSGRHNAYPQALRESHLPIA